MFREAKFKEDISKWNVSNVTNMSYMFEKAKEFNTSLDKWNVSNVRNMKYMFSRAYEFDVDINTKSVTVNGQTYIAWDVSNVTDMSQMFSFKQTKYKPFDKWNVSNVKNMEAMFLSTMGIEIKNIKGFNLDINTKLVTVNGQTYRAWDVSNVTNMRWMFLYSTFNKPLNKWNVSNVTNMDAMFYGNEKFKQDISDWNLNENVSIKPFNNSFVLPSKWKDKPFRRVFDPDSPMPASYMPKLKSQ